MKIYISIPISGHDYEKQKELANQVKAQYSTGENEVITPFDVVKSQDTPYNDAMGMCITALLGCDMVVFCGEWKKSKGCKAEYKVARVYAKTICTIQFFEENC